MSATQRWSRDGLTDRQAPPDEDRYGQMATAISRAFVGAAGVGEGSEGTGSAAGSVGSATPTGAVIALKDTGLPAPRPSPPESTGSTAGNAKILATTYFPERLPSQYLRRWRA